MTLLDKIRQISYQAARELESKCVYLLLNFIEMVSVVEQTVKYICWLRLLKCSFCGHEYGGVHDSLKHSSMDQ